ncbi:MAG: nucleoside 2-deoxyribosyltransferase domain-containing protein [Crocinitomicaceae bacterium]|nr:nucleoside 2-deoxyribosyltransferase domain-containing protein [Crocinitomicaceae bacterium]
MIFRPPNDISQIPQDRASVFLAGSMATTRKNNWRQTATRTFQAAYHFFDPTNPRHNNLNDEEMRNHIKWELEAMKLSDIIILNFLPDSLSPISLVEIGMYISSNKLVVVCPKEFYKWRYIDTLCNEYNTPIFNQLEDVLNGDLDTILNEQRQ